MFGSLHLVVWVQTVNVLGMSKANLLPQAQVYPIHLSGPLICWFVVVKDSVLYSGKLRRV